MADQRRRSKLTGSGIGGIGSLPVPVDRRFKVRF
jgi:hypothetical protein